MKKEHLLVCAILLYFAGMAPNHRRFSTLQALQAAESSLAGRDAHSEGILWEVWVSDELDGVLPRTVMKHYLRVKVLDERGAEMLSKVDIPQFGNTKISDVWAKTTRKSGEVLELKKDGIFEKLVAKAGDLKIRMTSFALPGLEPGAIVEYGWRERHNDELANYVRLPLQREYPVQTVRYHIKPLVNQYFPFAMRAITFHAQDQPFQKERDGFFGLTFSNMPAVEDEPDMPPENEVTAWLLIYYSPDEKLDPDKYWTKHGKDEFEIFKDRMKANNDVKRKAAELIEGTTTDEEKLKRLFLFCRSSIKNVSDPGSGLTIEQRRDFKENKNPADTLKHGIGTGSDIDLLFAALANGAGFEARYAKMADRSRYFFRKDYANEYFMQAWEIAVRVDGKWRFFDPASTYVPFGMLRWQEEGNTALVTDAKQPEMASTPVSPPESSVRRNLGSFELSEDGTLEGVVRVAHSGHRVVDRRREYGGLKDEERLEHLKTEIEEQFPGAEITNLQLSDVRNPDLPMVWSYHLKIPNYAQRTGKRIFVQPSVFQRGYSARYTAETRNYPICFRYPWMDVDYLTIRVPEGYEFDHADIPPNIPLDAVGHYQVSAQYNKATRVLTYQREFVFAKNLALMFKKEAYPAMKQVFDKVHAGDNHTLTLKAETLAP